MLPVVRLDFEFDGLTAAAKSASFLLARTLARRASPIYDVRSELVAVCFTAEVADSCSVAMHRTTTDPQPWENVLPVMSGKRAFLDLLKQEGVEIMFGNPGTTELPLMNAFATENELRYLLGLQEAAVMAMADGYAQASGKLAVVNLHVTPGLGNAMGMLYDAQKAGSPILVTAGQHEQSFNATEPILWADLPT